MVIEFEDLEEFDVPWRAVEMPNEVIREKIKEDIPIAVTSGGSTSGPISEGTHVDVNSSRHPSSCECSSDDINSSSNYNDADEWAH